MNDTAGPELNTLTKLVMIVAVLMVLGGVLYHGIAFETIKRVLLQLIERPSGPMSFRFILQPVMASIAAVHDARKDIRLGREPYLWTILHSPERRVARLNEAANATARIFLLGLVMDAVYQILVFERFFPVEAVVIAVILAFLPYVVVRGLALRIARRWRGGRSAHQA